MNIPYGANSTDGQIGEGLGRPKSQREVGGAVGANALAVLIPCHRVIRGDGDLSGYRWGRARKAALLALESAGEYTIDGNMLTIVYAAGQLVFTGQ